MENEKTDNKLLWRYAGLATQLMVGLGLFVYAGIKLDKWLKLRMPLAVWILPLLFITSVIIRTIIETGKKK
jgi:carbon starvation protein CstA